MRTGPGLALVVLVVLAGCNGLSAPTAPTAESADGGAVEPAEPAADPIGYENGVWYNETLSVDNEAGLNATERELVVARTMARIEYLRGTEFEQTVPVEIISREEFSERQGPSHSEEFRTFDNAKFEALFLIGERDDALSTQRDNQNENVLGFYDPSNDSIKLVAEGDEPTLDGEGTLAHELVHALQDQHHNLSSLSARTRDGANGQNALIEGEAQTLQQEYTPKCGAEWDCITAPADGDGGGGGMDLHWGIYTLKFFPYSDGPGFIAHLRDRDGWAAVDRAFEDPPSSSEQVIYPERYTGDRDEPTAVSLDDSASDDWERVRPSAGGAQDRPDHAVLGQSALSAMFGYTILDDKSGAVISRDAFITGSATDPFEYGLSATDGWEGDRLQVYQRAGQSNETAYVWRLEWDSAANAREFAETYRDLLLYHGAEPTSGTANVFRIDDGEFADAFYIDLAGDTVTIVNTPETDDVADVYDSR